MSQNNIHQMPNHLIHPSDPLCVVYWMGCVVDRIKSFISWKIPDTTSNPQRWNFLSQRERRRRNLDVEGTIFDPSAIQAEKA